MQKNEVFTFTAPNGVEVAGVVLDKSTRIDEFNDYISKYLCYAQNRLFWYIEVSNFRTGETEKIVEDVIVDYCILPAYDGLLEAYYHDHDVANDYADKTL